MKQDLKKELQDRKDYLKAIKKARQEWSDSIQNQQQKYNKALEEYAEFEKKLKEKAESEEVKYYRCITSNLAGYSLGLIYKREDDYIVDEEGEDSVEYDEEFNDFELVKKPKEGEKYWYISEGGIVDDNIWEEHKVDNFRWKQGNVFNTEES